MQYTLNMCSGRSHAKECIEVTFIATITIISIPLSRFTLQRNIPLLHLSIQRHSHYFPIHAFTLRTSLKAHKDAIAVEASRLTHSLLDRRP